MIPTCLLLFALSLACVGTGDDTAAASGDSLCAQETRATPYETGLAFETEDGAWSLHFVRADPTPPENGDNRWVLGLADATGAEVDDLRLTVEPTMPDHGHGTNPSLYETTWQAEDGGYVVEDLYLSMAGYWEFIFHVDDGSGTESLATLGLCLES